MERREFTKLLGGMVGAGLTGTASAAEGGFDPDLQDDPLSEIEILTTEYDESHVYADDIYSLGYGNGYVQARDRLFQIDAIRHVGYGNSAQVLGPAQLSSDIQVRRDLYGPDQIRQQWENASETIRKAVKGYTDGVNRRMTEMAAQGELPAEFAALGHAPEPWKPEDTVACINYLIGFFGVGGGGELGNAKNFARLVESLGDERDAFEAYEDLNWLQSTEDHFTSIPEDDLTAAEIDPDLIEEVPDFEEVPDEQLELAKAALGAEPWGIEADYDLPEAVTNGERVGQGLMSGFKWGSNAFVIDGDLTETGDPMLGGGPQMGTFKPPIPYEIGLHGAGFDMSGMGVPGAPAQVIGRTDSMAWTVTSGRDDQIDTIAVELDPEDKHRYKWEGDWYEMETQTVVHRASPVVPATTGEADTRVVKQEVARIEQDGDQMPVVAWNPEENVAWCQRITTRNDELPGAFIWADLARTDSLEEFEEGLAEFPFTFNFHVAEYDEDDDDPGEIAYYHTGKIPERSGDYDYRFPTSPDRHSWEGMRVGTGLGTYDRNPSRGYYVNWNNGPVTGWRAGDSEQNWGSRHRVESQDHFIREKIGVSDDVPDGPKVKEKATDTISVADVRDIEFQSAKHDSTAQVSVPLLVEAAEGDKELQDVVRVLKEWREDYCPWDGDKEDGIGAGTMDYPGHAVFDRARQKLEQRVFGDELNGVGSLTLEPARSRHASDHGNASSDVTFLDALAGETTHDWLADVSDDTGIQRTNRGQRKQTRRELVRDVLKEVKDELVEEYSADPDSWADPGHTTKFLSLGLSVQTNIHVQNRSSYNQAIDLGKFNSDNPEVWQANCQDVCPPSNSGHVNPTEAPQVVAQGTEPERLRNQLDIYVTNGPYKPHPHTRTQVEQVAVESTTVRPTPEHEFTPVVPAAPRPLPFPVDIPDADAPGGAPGAPSPPAGAGSDSDASDGDASGDGGSADASADGEDGGNGSGDTVDVPDAADASDTDDVTEAEDVTETVSRSTGHTVDL